MSNSISKESQYQEMLTFADSLIVKGDHLISIMANVSALVYKTFGFHWVGFYLVDNDILYLGPFQGPVACTTIPFGKGVCGDSWKEKRTIIVENVDLYPGHIACSSLSRSEIVVPLLSDREEVFAVLDIDSSELASFDDIDEKYLKLLCGMICKNAK